MCARARVRACVRACANCFKHKIARVSTVQYSSENSTLCVQILFKSSKLWSTYYSRQEPGRWGYKPHILKLQHTIAKSCGLLLFYAITYTAEWTISILSFTKTLQLYTMVWNDHAHFEWISKLAVYSFTFFYVTQNILKDYMKGIIKKGIFCNKKLDLVCKVSLILFDNLCLPFVK